MYTFVKYSLLIFFGILTITSCAPSWSCNKGLLGTQSTRWKLCVKRNQNVIQMKMVNLFKRNDTINSQLLAIGFPRIDEDKFLEIIEDQGTVKLKPNKMNCSLSPKKNDLTVIVKCNNGESLSSESIEIYYLLSNGSHDIKPEDFKRNHLSLTFRFHQKPSHSNAVKFAKDYGKSMAAIVGIAFFLTTVITVTVCYCCKKKAPLKTDKAKTKDVSVAFYRDNGEAENENSDDDENVAFIPNNNERNSSV